MVRLEVAFAKKTGWWDKTLPNMHRHDIRYTLKSVSVEKEKPPSERAGERLSQKPIIRLFYLLDYTSNWCLSCDDREINNYLLYCKHSES